MKQLLRFILALALGFGWALGAFGQNECKTAQFPNGIPIQGTNGTDLFGANHQNICLDPVTGRVYFPGPGIVGEVNSGTSVIAVLNGVFDFLANGATCNGVSDDTAIWNAAMAFASLPSKAGARIIFPRGKICRFPNGVTITQPNVVLDCQGGFASNEHNGVASALPSCEILCDGGNNVTCIDTLANPTAAAAISPTIQNLFIKGLATGAGTGNGIHITTNATTVQNNVISTFGACGISVDSSVTNANPNFFKLINNYIKFNKGDGICYNAAVNLNDNVGWSWGNTLDTNGGWGQNFIGVTFTNLIMANHHVGNTSGGIQVAGGAGSGNIFIDNYLENDGHNGVTLTATSSNNLYIATSGGAVITDLGTNNQIIASGCAETGFASNKPCMAPMISIAPKAGAAGKLYTFTNGQQTANSLSIFDDTDNKELIRLDGTFPTVIFPQATILVGEGTTLAGNAGNDQLSADSTAHRFKMNNNNAGVVTVGTVPLYTSNGTEQLGSPHNVQDTCTLGTNCGVTLSGSAVYTSSTSYTCVCEDETAIAACKVAQTSGSAFTITGTGTDVIRYSCTGN